MSAHFALFRIFIPEHSTGYRADASTGEERVTRGCLQVSPILRV